MSEKIDEILNNSINYTLCGATFRVRKEDDLFLLCEIFPEDFMYYSGLKGDEDELLEGILDSIDVSAFIQEEGFYEGLILFAYEEYEATIGGFSIEDIKVDHMQTLEGLLKAEGEYFDAKESDCSCSLPF